MDLYSYSKGSYNMAVTMAKTRTSSSQTDRARVLG